MEFHHTDVLDDSGNHYDDGSVLDSPAFEEAWDQQPARWNIQVSGTVQGVGFRAFVYGLAKRLNLRGFVTSQPGALAIEVEGARASLGDFLEELWLGAPRRARIEQLSCHSGPALGADEFHIVGRD